MPHCSKFFLTNGDLARSLQLFSGTAKSERRPHLDWRHDRPIDWSVGVWSPAFTLKPVGA